MSNKKKSAAQEKKAEQPEQKDAAGEYGLPEPQTPTVIPEPANQLPPGSAIPI
jgi:hypothetical protein